MKKLMITVAAIVAMGVASAQATEIVKVMGRGVGADKIEALKDAYRDAVERAVGLYVDAEQMMKNEELVKDQILTHSNAYIEKYDVVGETVAPNGLVTVKILAEVKSKTLTTKMAEVMPAMMYRLGGDLSAYHAKSTTVEKRNQDGAELLKEFLKDFDPLRSTIDFTLANPKIVVTERENQDNANVAINYLFKLEINQDRYFSDVVPKFREVLRQISIKDPSSEYIGCNPDAIVDVEKLVKDIIEKRCDCCSSLNYHTRFDKGSVNLKLAHNERKETKTLYLVIDKNKHGTAYKIEKYELDKKCKDVFLDWYCKRYNVGPWVNDAPRCPMFSVSLLDSVNDILYSKEVAPWSAPIESEWRMSIISLGNWYYDDLAIGPWHWRDKSGGITLRKYRWIQFQIPKDIMPEIANMKIEMK